MVESCVGGLPGGVLYKGPEDVLEAFVKDCLPTLVSKLQRDLMELHTTTVFDNTGTTTSRDWKFGLLINVPKFPVSPDGKSEDIALGLNFVKTEWLEMPLWPFIDKVVFLTQLKDLQLSVGWNTNQPVKVTRYFGVIIMSGENNLAISMVQNAHKGVWLSNNDNPYKIKWGTLRMDLHHLESHKMKERQYYKPLIKVWRCMHVPFPLCQMHGRSEEEPLEMSIGHRFMLDFILDDVNIKDLDKEIKAFLADIQGGQSGGQNARWHWMHHLQVWLPHDGQR